MATSRRSDLSSTAHSCIKCAQSFSTSTALADHSRSTGHLIPRTTSGCTKNFTSQQALQQHLNSPVHKDAPSKNQLPVRAQHIHTVPVRKEPMESTQTAGGSISTMKNKPGYSGASQVSHMTVKLPAIAVGDLLPSDIHNGAFKATNTFVTSPLPLVQGNPHILNANKHPFQSRLAAESQGESPNSALPPDEMPQSVRNASLYELYTPYDMDDCYLIATPRNGGKPLVSPLMVDHGGNGFEFSLLLPMPQQQAQAISLVDPGSSCKFCGFAFASWESLRLHFGSSACSTLPTRLPTEGSITPLKSFQERVIPNERATMGTNTPKLHGGIEPKPQALATHPSPTWSVIPVLQRAASLAALDLNCHSYATLTKNKYTSGPGYAKVPGAEVALSLIPLPSPAHDTQVPKRGAVALDCEMVGVGRNGESEVARLSAIDYLSGEVLIDSLVQPTRPVTDWRTRFSGITKNAMAVAVAENRVLKGWPEARAELWKYIDSNTVLVGQALHHDFDGLRMQHWKVVDSGILAKDAVGTGVSRQWGLKTMCDQFLGIEIQNNGKSGHDSVEDAFAAREVVLWCIGHMEELAVWGRKQKEEFERKKKQREAKRGKKSQQTPSSHLKPRYHTEE